MATEANQERQFSEFVGRHIGPQPDDVAQMLATIGVSDLDALVDATLPEHIRFQGSLNIAAGASESAVLAELAELASRNTIRESMIGLGYYGTVMPSVIRRRVLESPAWYTAYTPYQPEISQGRLEALLNFQTMVTDLSGCDLANASLLDEGTAAGEAMSMARRASKAAKDAVFLMDAGVFPQTAAVVQTRAWPVGIEVLHVDLGAVHDEESLLAASGGRAVFGVLVQYPSANGQINDYRALTQAVHAAKGLVAVCADLLALTLLTPPGEWGADIVVGSTQRFGVPMQFGGPHAGYMAIRKGLERTMPGRLVGVSRDSAGAPAYRLALQTREQHIRRERATSNICTAQVLLAVLAAMYAVYHGPNGLTALAMRIHAQASVLAKALSDHGITVENQRWFDTLAIRVPGRAAQVSLKALARNINVWRADDDTIYVSCDETTTSDTVVRLLGAFGIRMEADEVERAVAELSDPEGAAGLLSQQWGASFVRTSPFLTAPAFNAVHSETQMLRYQRRLSDRDYALDRGMIPLGSCTMKLNAATEMEAITWPSFADLHPFAPADQTQGIRELINEVGDWLLEVTGYDAITMQPNSGAAGELAALTAIRDYHGARGEQARDVCLIPASAHGTNAASAVMAGFTVVVVASAADGSIDLADLEAKLAAHEGRVGAIMVTYPSTHGVYEDTITTLTDLVHAAGGQVYIDGANMNALVGVAKPGRFGGDASHLNLHKTFAIPHGGGGPGVGPVGVKAHLAPYLPNHPLDRSAGPTTSSGPCASAPFGSAGVLPITWAYLRLMGAQGLAQATKVAVLNANYIAARLRAHYPVLYSGHSGLVAHECILDLRELTRASGVTVDDVAKRLIDYGFHAPTMSFPVAGTLMVEPTESEDKAELDRFCEAMIAIRGEIAEIEQDRMELCDSPLRHAPHTAACLVADWDRPYERSRAVFPPGVDPLAKYWPVVGRIDSAHGDRNLVCTCPPPEAFA